MHQSLTLKDLREKSRAQIQDAIISGPNISMPDVDFNLKGPKLKGDVDDVCSKVQGDIKASKVEIEGPEIEGPEGGFKMPKMKMHHSE